MQTFVYSWFRVLLCIIHVDRCWKYSDYIFKYTSSLFLSIVQISEMSHLKSENESIQAAEFLKNSG